MNGRWLGGVLGALLVLVGAPAAAVAATTAATAKVADAVQADEPATLRILNRDIVTLRSRLAGATPRVRIERVSERMRELPATAILNDTITAVPFALGEAKGVTFLLGHRPLFSLQEGDVDVEAVQTFDALTQQTQQRLEEVRDAWRELHNERRLVVGVLRTAGATLLLAFLIWSGYRASRGAVKWMEERRDMLAARHPYVDWREFLARIAVGSMQLVRWLVLLGLLYWWAFFVLGSFAVTSPLAHTLGDWLLGKAIWVAEGLLDSLPGLATVLVVLVLTRAAVDVLGYFFQAVQQGRLRVRMFHPETASATYGIFKLLVWALGIVIAYPYVPGSNSDAFKGISVLIGLMVTLGSAGLITQAMSGLVVVYSRSLRKGDFVDINGVQGVVTEVASLATKVVNVRNEEITIPYSVVVSTPIRNYTKLGGSQGTLLTTKVTIGYDAPWRQVHEMLIGAARKTPGVRTTPEPYVYQRALSDFYVEYELFANIADPARRIPILSDLHASILDEFNAHGVQIMSPHFALQPRQAVLVEKGDRYAAPAEPPP
ncbi:MAG TPA: mechanosensitive ion channel domain-containing protein [Caldimonas sp.]